MNSKVMSFKRLAVFATAVGSLAIVIVALFSPNSSLTNSLPFVHSAPINSISGLAGGDGPVLVVKVDDTPEAHPQVGLEAADIVYIEQVEGGLTRLAAVFSSHIPEKVGPVRSARISDIDLFAQYGHVGFAFSGVQKRMRPVINSANMQDLGAENHSAKIFTNDVARTPPYAMVLRADLLMQFVDENHIKLATSKNMGWNFGVAPAGGVAINSVHLSWPANSYDAHWSVQEGRWLLDHAHSPDLASSGIQLGPKTLVIQNVVITDSIYKDKVGGVTPFSATIGSGSGYILRDGMYFAATWSRPDAASGTTWKSSDGKEISFAKGQIWVALTDTAPVFQPIAADAPSAKAK